MLRAAARSDCANKLRCFRNFSTMTQHTCGGTRKRSNMKWQAAVAGAIASALITSVASAEMRVTNDPGGEITSYVTKFENLRASGERLVIDGPCLSACTLFTAFLPRQQVCVTPRAILGFHAASYYT